MPWKNEDTVPNWSILGWRVVSIGSWKETEAWLNLCDLKICNKGLERKVKAEWWTSTKSGREIKKASPRPQTTSLGLCCPVSLLCFLPSSFFALHSLFRSLPDSCGLITGLPLPPWNHLDCFWDIDQDITPAHEGISWGDAARIWFS